MHVYRVAIFVAIVASIHDQHRWYVAQQRSDDVQPLAVEQVSAFFPDAETVGAWDPDHGGQRVSDATGNSLGFVVQTSPEADDVVGFSGPTNTMIAFGSDDRILGISVLRSGDTREHTDSVIRNESFMTALNGLSWQPAAKAKVDAVSGATLTSMAIAEGITLRLGGENPASRFPAAVALEEVKAFFETAADLRLDDEKPSMLRVLDAAGATLGKVARTSPHTDSIIGYQGPTDTLFAIDHEGRTIGAAIRHSYDNEPYVRYVKEDEYFFNIFKGFTVDQIAQLDMVDAGIEGVSGATRTSIAVAEGLIHSTQVIQRERPATKETASWFSGLAARDYGTAAVVAVALVIALTHLRGKRRLRVVFQIVLVVYLGFINADVVSQALLVGWARNGVAWRVAPGLVLLTFAALACPVFTGRQIYCTHVCPFGALQDWMRRVPHPIKVPGRILKVLRFLPAALLLWVILVAKLHLPISLVGIEPFDAFVIRIAGWATITVAAIGLIASLFVPMAYCRHGCPTGAMLSFLRFHSACGRFTRRDAVATLLAVIAFSL
ncbi:MAG: FMN-binding protein [Fuerstiella sp.]|nr:FMN-binding protein [Fuerstiella sp.]